MRAYPHTVVPQHQSLAMYFIYARAIGFAVDVDVELLHAPLILLPLLGGLLRRHGLRNTSHGGDGGEDKESDNHVGRMVETKAVRGG